MIGEWVRVAFDLILIVMVGAGLVQALRLIRHLAGLHQGRADMERFVHEFNATVMRAEAGIKGLRMAARESGDDLEKLVEKAVMVRDELNFIVDSADNIAERLSQSATAAARIETPSKKAATPAPIAEPPASDELPPSPTVAVLAARKAEAPPPAPSRAEKELLQALRKLN